MKKIKLEMVADWQEIDEVYENDGEPVLGVWVGDGDESTFIELEKFIRYGIPWMGDAPECEDINGNEIKVHGIGCDMSVPYFIEINDSTQEIRLWGEMV